MSEHTPGPWIVAGSCQYGWDIYAGDLWIDSVKGSHGGHRGFPSDKEGEANARLIAAAPDMLAALKGVLPYMEAAESQLLVGDEGCHWPVEAVRAAIAKAEGSHTSAMSSER